MNTKKIFLISIFAGILLTTPQIASACENKFSYPAYGYLNKEDLDRLKREYRNRSMEINRENQLYLS